MRIAVTQFKVRDVSDFDEFAEHVRWHVQGARLQGADFVVFPEYLTSELLSAVPGAHEADSAGVRRIFERMAREYSDLHRELFAGLAGEHNMHIVAGSHFYHHDADDRYYNASFLFVPGGSVFEQRKTHRAYELVHNRDMVTAGDELRTFDTDFGRIGVTVCYDCAFPEVARSLVLQGAEILFNPACVFNLYGVHRMRTYSAARAVENQCFVANSQILGGLSLPSDNPITFTGRSAIHTPADPAFGPADGIAVEGTLDVEQVVSADVDIERLREYRRDGVPAMLQERRPELYAGVAIEPPPAPLE